MKLAVAYRRRKVASRLAKASRLIVVCAASAALAAPEIPAFAQSPDAPAAGQTAGARQSVSNPHMLLQADRLIYDFDHKTVTAVGNVQIYYHGYALDADKVTYDQKSGRLIATGGVRMLDPDGNLITTDKLDITDDFRDGFIASLNLITTDRTHFAAQTAERRDGNLTIFRKGAYTACQPCLDHPERPPLWQIKAARIIHDKSQKTIYFERAWLEFFGLPVAYMPVLLPARPDGESQDGLPRPFVAAKRRDRLRRDDAVLLEPCPELRCDLLADAAEPAGSAHAGGMAPAPDERLLLDPRRRNFPARPERLHRQRPAAERRSHVPRQPPLGGQLQHRQRLDLRVESPMPSPTTRSTATIEFPTCRGWSFPRPST